MARGDGTRNFCHFCICLTCEICTQACFYLGWAPDFEVATRFTHPGASVLAGEIEGSQVTVAGGTTTTDAPLPSTKAASLVLPREAITLGGDGLAGWRVACHEPTESGLDLLCRHEDDPIPGNLLRVPCPAHEPTPAVGAGVTLTLIPSRMLVFPGRSNG